MKPILEEVTGSLSQLIGKPVSILNQVALAGGSINQVSHITLDNGVSYLLKTQTGIPEDTYRIEHDSLLLLAEADAIRVPEPLVYADNFLLMEYIQEGAKADDWQEQLGRGLALLQQQTRQEKFGFYCDNYLGSSLQLNAWHDDWLTFWRENRLGPQIQLLVSRLSIEDPLIKKAKLLLDKLDTFLAEIKEPAVLLHGDLWSGNAMADSKGAPVIFDPACYFGHREAEFGMMRMFGGFGARCEAAYAEIWPFADGYEERFSLYQLYHELNHLILFGSVYYSACVNTLDSLM